VRHEQITAEATDWVNRLDNGQIEPGIERITSVLHYLGNPQDQVSSIHVAGTNGKGSVCAMLASIYRAAGYRVGLYTSPHLIDIQERIRVLDPSIPEEGMQLNKPNFADAAHAVRRAMQTCMDAEGIRPLTHFEVLTAMAFWTFLQHRVDVAIIETGLGGRLDATNVMQSPLATVITAIDQDHMDRLGHTLPQIAYEKAGILRPGIPVFTPMQQHPEAMQVIADRAETMGSCLYPVDAAPWGTGALRTEGDSVYREVWHKDYPASFYLGLVGRYQIQNLSLVWAVVQSLSKRLPVSLDALAEGIRHVRWPGRMSVYPACHVVIDGSHNPAGFAQLLETLHNDFADRTICWGLSLMANRPLDWLKPLIQSPQTEAVYAVASAPPERFHVPDAIVRLAIEAGVPLEKTDTATPLSTFCQGPTQFPTLHVVTGSLYTVGQALNGQSEFFSL
jgi:dihydrofolate synthase/folylpolyglutamate synthase